MKKNDLLAERLYLDICFSYVTKLKKKMEIKNHGRDIKINAADNSNIVKSKYIPKIKAVQNQIRF